jgi:Mg2+ and Co2+ transporter CorA
MQQESIEKLVALELKSAEAKFPKHNSAHESYAVLREEVDEVNDEIEVISEEMNELWSSIKKNHDAERMKISVDIIRETAVKLIEESIQVVAMCDRMNKDVLHGCPF